MVGRKSPMQPMKLPIALIRLGCVMQCLAVGLLGPSIPRTISEEEISEIWFQNDSAIWRISRATVRKLFLFSEIELFRKNHGPHAH